MRQHYTNTCILCDTKIPSKYTLCANHFRLYKNYMHELWFIELMTLQRAQYTIDKLENFNIPYNKFVDLSGNYTVDFLQYKKRKGRPSTDLKIVEKILDIYDNSIEDVLQKKRKRAITINELSCLVSLPTGTVYDIIKKYRSKKK